jgi:hypothetical protein
MVEPFQVKQLLENLQNNDQQTTKKIDIPSISIGVKAH